MSEEESNDNNIPTKIRGRGKYKIRYDKVIEGHDLLEKCKCDDGTADQKLTFLFADLKKHIDGYLFKELCLIMHPDKTELEEGTGNPVPNFYGYMQTRQEMAAYRKNRNLDGIIIYCLWNDKLKLEVYFNISTLELMAEVLKKNKKIIQGIQRNMNNAIKYLKFPPEMKRQLSRLAKKQLRQQIMEKIQKEQALKRKKEIEEFEQQHVQ